MLVTSSITDDDQGTDSGSVTVFRLVGSTWVEEAHLLPSDAAPTVLENVLLDKKDQPKWQKDESWKEEFELD